MLPKITRNHLLLRRDKIKNLTLLIKIILIMAKITYKTMILIKNLEQEK